MRVRRTTARVMNATERRAEVIAAGWRGRQARPVAPLPGQTQPTSPLDTVRARQAECYRPNQDLPTSAR